MNFSDILNLANSNTQNDKKDGNFYKAKFTAPKKETKDKKLSANIQKFLQKREQEEMIKAKEAEQKRNALLAMRDTKAKNKIRKMLKVIKSADKSVIEDAKAGDAPAVAEQPDEDDYGYVSHEANAYYSKLMEKYGTNTPEEKKQRSNGDQKKSKFSIKETLERTKSQLNAETSQNGGHRRAHKAPERAYVEPTNTSKPQTNGSNNSAESQKPKEKPKPTHKAPPPLAFSELLKIAEKKQHEPIKISVPVVPKQEERLMSSKEKLEHEERMRFLQNQKKRRLEAERGYKASESKPIPKINQNLTPSKEKKPEIAKSSQIKPTTPKAMPNKPQEKTKPELAKKPQMQQKPSSSSSSMSTSSTRPIDRHQRPPNGKVKKDPPPKRRIYDEDDESEYDSMDSFIDDEGTEDVSSYIKEIFGYDKSRYRDDYDDTRDMESSFAQQMREESISKKIGLMEDLEDMKQEELAKKRKMMMKKRQRL